MSLSLRKDIGPFPKTPDKPSSILPVNKCVFLHRSLYFFLFCSSLILLDKRYRELQWTSKGIKWKTLKNSLNSFWAKPTDFLIDSIHPALKPFSLKPSTGCYILRLCERHSFFLSPASLEDAEAQHIGFIC